MKKVYRSISNVHSDGKIVAAYGQLFIVDHENLLPGVTTCTKITLKETKNWNILMECYEKINLKDYLND